MKKKLVIFCDYFGNGGIEKISTYIKNNIDKKIFSSQILCTINDSQIYNDKVYSISNKKYKNPIYRFIKTSLNIKKFTKDSDIVNINIHSPIELFYAFLIRNISSKIVVYAHNSDFDNNYLGIKTLIAYVFRYIFCSNDYTYIACSKESAEFCFKKNTKYDIIKNEIDSKKYLYNENRREEIRKKYCIDKKDIVIGNIGRLSKQKNQTFLIKIFMEFIKIKPNSKLFLIGKGKEGSKIKKIINKEKLNKQVFIISEVQNIENMYQMFDFYVSTSKYEGYGLTIYEALCSSLKCFVPKNISSNFSNKNIIEMEFTDSPYDWAKKIEQEIGYKRVICNINNDDKYIRQIEEIYMR